MCCCWIALEEVSGQNAVKLMFCFLHIVGHVDKNLVMEKYALRYYWRCFFFLFFYSPHCWLRKDRPAVSAANGNYAQREGKTGPSSLLQEEQDSVKGHLDLVGNFPWNSVRQLP